MSMGRCVPGVGRRTHGGLSLAEEEESRLVSLYSTADLVQAE